MYKYVSSCTPEAWTKELDAVPIPMQWDTLEIPWVHQEHPTSCTTLVSVECPRWNLPRWADWVWEAQAVNRAVSPSTVGFPTDSLRSLGEFHGQRHRHFTGGRREILWCQASSGHFHPCIRAFHDYLLGQGCPESDQIHQFDMS